MKKILVMIDWFEPAFKAGGPIRTVSNMVKLLQDHYEIFIFTSDRDLAESRPLPDVEVNRWVPFGSKMKVYYASPDQLSWAKVSSVITSLSPDFIYCSGMFSKYSSIYPALMKRLGKFNAELILSPHGMLKPSALAFKPFKKKVFLNMYKWLSLPKKIHFHATDKNEVEDITNEFGKVAISSVLDAPAPFPDKLQFIIKEEGVLRILFVGRIHPVKNLSLLLQALKDVKRVVSLTIIGTKEDPDYWDTCQRLVEVLPGNISVNEIGDVSHEKIQSLINDHHIFSLPTQGENFGHSIYEALISGRPVLISDQTPWRNLAENKAGWDIPLHNIGEYTRVIDEAANWTNKEYDLWVKGARNYVDQKIDFKQILEQYNKLFS